MYMLAAHTSGRTCPAALYLIDGPGLVAIMIGL
jgi:hypothetical protein